MRSIISNTRVAAEGSAPLLEHEGVFIDGLFLGSAGVVTSSRARWRVHRKYEQALDVEKPQSKAGSGRKDFGSAILTDHDLGLVLREWECGRMETKRLDRQKWEESDIWWGPSEKEKRGSFPTAQLHMHDIGGAN